MFGVHIDCLDRDNKRRTGAGAGTNTTMINSLVIANLMTEESKRILMDNRKKRNIPKDYIGNIECSILVKNSTVDLLKEISTGNNSENYDQLILRLTRCYREHHHEKL